jgi:integrase
MLSDIQARKAKSQDKPYKLPDEKGLYLYVTPRGGKLWRYDYRHNGKRKTLSFGAYPDVSLFDARNKLLEARKVLAAGVDPMAKRKAEKALNAERAANCFEALTLEFIEHNSKTWTVGYKDKFERLLRREAFPYIGGTPVAELKAPELLIMLKRIVERGLLESASRTKQAIGQVMRYAVATGRAECDPTSDLRGALPSPKEKHFSTIVEPVEIGALMRAIDSYKGSPVVRAALKLAPMVFLRPGELAGAEWRDFDIDAAEWKIPGERMKMEARHIVPLSHQAIAVLKELYPLTGSGRFVFSTRKKCRAAHEPGERQSGAGAHGLRPELRNADDRARL